MSLYGVDDVRTALTMFWQKLGGAVLVYAVPQEKCEGPKIDGKRRDYCECMEISIAGSVSI